MPFVLSCSLHIKEILRVLVDKKSIVIECYRVLLGEPLSVAIKKDLSIPLNASHLDTFFLEG